MAPASVYVDSREKTIWMNRIVARVMSGTVMREPGCEFVPTLVEIQSDTEIMVKDFETDDWLKDHDKQKFRFLMALASLFDALFALYADVADAHVTALRTNMYSTLACLNLDKKHVMIDGKRTVYFVLK
jgi:hypothetical protein